LETGPAITGTFAVYLVAMLAIGGVAYWRTRDLSDYLLGGRKLGRWVTALSAQASDMSGWLLLGLPGYAYAAGLEAGWIALGLLAGTYLNWTLVARRLRTRTEAAGNALTLPEFLERRFDDRTRLLRITSAFFILLFFLFYTSAGLVAGGKLFSVLGLSYSTAVLAGALTILAYTFMGGFFAVSWTDTAQGTLMLLALVLVPVAAISQLGGVSLAIASTDAVAPTAWYPLAARSGEPLSFIAWLSLLGWGLGYFGQPHILARFMAIRSAEEIPAARAIAMTWVTLALSGALAVGLTGIALLGDTLNGADSEKVFLVLVQSLLHPIAAGICLAAVLAAVMSTADSQLLVSSSALTEDFYKALLRKDASQRELIWVGRGAVALIASCALALALDPDSKVMDLVSYAWAGFGAAFGPTLLLALFWDRMTREGALAGIVTGGLTVILWKQLSGGIFDLYEIIPGFLFSSLAVVAVSLAGRPATQTLRR
jgi:sodium/proline symporter